MAFSHGKNAKIRLNAVDYSIYLNEGGMGFDQDVAETSALGTQDKTYVPGMNDGKFTLSGMFDPVVDAALWGFKGNAAVPFDYRPAGDTAGFIKYTGNCIMTSYEINTGTGDMASIKADFQVTGPITRATI